MLINDHYDHSYVFHRFAIVAFSIRHLITNAKKEYQMNTVIHVNIVYFYQEKGEEQAERLL